jgi:hypothetical protein
MCEPIGRRHLLVAVRWPAARVCGLLHPHIVPVCFDFSQLLATKSCCGLLNTQLFS